MDVQDAIIKHTLPVRIAEATAIAPGFGHENIGPVFERLVPELTARLDQAGARPGVCVAYYDWPAEDGSIVVHVGLTIGGQSVADSDRVRVVDLPVVEVASVVHRGPMDDIAMVYGALVRWIEDSGYRLDGRSRELYHEWHDDAPTRHITELQLPIAR